RSPAPVIGAGSPTETEFGPGEGGGQKPLAISVFGRPVFRPFRTVHSACPRTIVFGQTEGILLQGGLKREADLCRPVAVPAGNSRASSPPGAGSVPRRVSAIRSGTRRG